MNARRASGSLPVMAGIQESLSTRLPWDFRRLVRTKIGIQESLSTRLVRTKIEEFQGIADVSASSLFCLFASSASCDPINGSVT
jgi:hypothetical protein